MALAGGLVIAACAFIPFVANFAKDIDRRLGDRNLYHPGKPEPREDLVFLGVDEDTGAVDPALLEDNPTLARMNERFPWDRRVYAAMLERLFEAGARLVILDFVFAEASDPEADAELAEVLRKYSDRVILSAVFAPMSTEHDGFMLMEPYYGFLEAVPTLEYGFVNFWPDQTDGLVRDAYYSRTLSEANGGNAIEGEYRFDSLAGAALHALGKEHAFPVAQMRYSVRDEVMSGGSEKSLGTGIYPPISVRNIFIPDEWERNFASGEYFRDKVVLIGPAAARFQDNQDTPVGLLLGPQLHLQAIAAGLGNDFVFRPFGEWRGWIFWSGLAGAAFAAILIYFLRRPLIALTATATVIAAAILGTWAYARWGATWIGPTPFAASLFVGAVCGQSYDLLKERMERSRLHNQFRRFVSRDVADSLVNDPSIYKQAATGRKRRVVVLFSDIRGFTSLSEQISPEELFELLNEYLTAMVKVIFTHGGTLDKFIGDAILAHWGALDDGDESTFANSALQATEVMIEELDRLNADWKMRGLPELGIGIGLHLGEVLAGEIGSEQRTEFGVIGDAVNLASRLEGMTKAFSCQWLGSGQFIKAAGIGGRLRRIARVQVKGREEPVDLWTSVMSEEARAAYDLALGHFEAGDFDKTLSYLEKYVGEFADDRVATHLLGHTRRFLELRPPDWKGVIKFNEK